MRYKRGVLKRTGVGVLVTLLLGAPGFAEESVGGPVSATDSAQVAAIAFFNRIARESGNPYIMAGARESAARLENRLSGHSPAEHGGAVRPARVEVPVIAQPDNSIAVPVLVNDKAMGTFMIDTGASYTVITPRLAAKLGVETGPDTPKIALITANGMIQAPVVTLGNVTIGQVRVRNVQAVVQDLGQDMMLSGLLGLNFFKGKTLTIRQDRLILEEALEGTPATSGDESRLSSRGAASSGF
jgi:clan AA aspartic protease (TIGR02281 family)